MAGSYDLICERIPGPARYEKKFMAGNDRPFVLGAEPLEAEIEMLRVEIDRLHNIAQQAPPAEDEPPDHVDGWRISKQRGYWRASRRIGKLVATLHLGRVFNLDAAKEKIREKETMLARSD